MQILYTIYLILICTVLPIYMKDGYYELGEAKAICYILISAPFAALLLLKGSSEAGSKERTIIVPEFFLYGTAFSMLISFVFSIDKKIALLGFEGWRNGLLVSAIAIVFSILLSQKEYKVDGRVLAVLMIVPFLEAILSILNRFSVFPLVINGQNTSFLATIGNINWFSGFLSIWAPLGIGIMYLQKNFSWKFWVSGVYTIVMLISLMLQGSDGAVLILIGAYGLLLFWSLSDRDSFKRFLIQLVVLGLSMTIVDVVMLFAGSAYNYDNNILISLCEAHIGMILVAAAFFIYRVCRLLEEIKATFRGTIYKWIYVAALLVGITYAVAMAVMGFGDDFGNGRGIIYRMCADLYMNLSPWQQLVGIGQDCLYPYAMKDAMWSSSFRNVFGDIALTNAHCEFLTILIERGMIGAALYVGLFVSAIFQLFKVKEKEPKAVALGLPIISYFVYNQISFQQIMAMPYCYILLGMGIYLGKLRNRD